MKYHSPYHWDPQNGTPNLLGNPQTGWQTMRVDSAEALAADVTAHRISLCRLRSVWFAFCLYLEIVRLFIIAPIMHCCWAGGIPNVCSLNDQGQTSGFRSSVKPNCSRTFLKRGVTLGDCTDTLWLQRDDGRSLLRILLRKFSEVPTCSGILILWSPLPPNCTPNSICALTNSQRTSYTLTEVHSKNPAEPEASEIGSLTTR